MVKKLNETDAKQGRTGRPILIVLIAGVALIVLGYMIVGSIGVATSPDGSLEQTDTIEAPASDTGASGSEVVTPEESDPQQNEGVTVPE
ncbi:hypothetical protein FP2506_09201 [Fulvimarina pelagi HTCC2506]|uniref:Uncharacterized protein n=1 Tax=Fulvimarina pelagi HTCC2506 TaxID=314231 RepID=Q0G5Q6_9HYPH|nr:hypothetical protein [Fulvimarina pelagi]EAU43008.1 hypothetical protein FP2506_09201 [Fulvimarina pelagi HTCC2506]